MKKLDQIFTSSPLPARFGAYLAAVATVGMLALGTASLFTPAQAGPQRDCGNNRDNYDNKNNHGNQCDQDLQELSKSLQEADVAEIEELLAGFHGALSYGGDMDAMMSLWADGSSITFNGTLYAGKAGVQTFFSGNGYFHNNWVSLAPEFKTQITLHGDKAEAVTQCVATDISVTPNVVKGVVQVNAVAEKIHGKWVFISMNNTSPAPL